MTTTAVSFASRVNETVEAVPAGVAEWLVPSLVGAAVILVVIVSVVALRERYHRRRRNELQKRLADLEGILIGLSTTTPASTVRAAVGSSDSTIQSNEEVVPRGPLSTAISILRHDLGPGLPGPDRVDLRATVFVYDHLDQPVTPADLAGDLNLSLRSLQRGLSTSLGCTPRELILAVKMREAKRLLLDDEHRVQEAARAVGYEDPFHFSRRFKSYYGMSPTEMQLRNSRCVA
jgi:AraC-like DNA-binding protein/membrane protein implicated in regulation of membrane protease activity